MSEQATVVAFKHSSGRVALRTGSGRFALAEQTDSSALREGLGLSGNMSESGPEVWSDDSGQSQYQVFVLGRDLRDLSQEAVEQEV
ncbi:hypothetical protein O987_13360 [Comamonas testosteroni TK102]|uniref:Uncharacterized protein n=1 Tax=Comamonas testosteroni TK102 TaxID=1392005 RepID=A0A076PST3_COMTE|nr:MULTISPECIES: hypothetical protein [Comamonas]AIJ46790.1 hypothetical protein O987_13360 [Comamonas testosteroni TK102]MPS89635.1 hypothetical protein [Comamonas sp.]